MGILMGIYARLFWADIVGYIYIFENMIWVLYLKIGRVVYLNLWPSNDTEDGD